MRIAAFFSTGFGAFLLAFACFEYLIGDLECAASTSVLSGFFIGSGLLLLVTSRRRTTRLTRLAPDHDWLRQRQNVLSPDVALSARQVPEKELSHVGEVERSTDFRTMGKRADVRKLIEELHNQTPDGSK